MKVKKIQASELIEVNLPFSDSRIIKQNKGTVHVSVYKEMKGIFDKKIPENRKFGELICNKIKGLGCNGFFSSDELPAYGISQKEMNLILSKTNPSEKDLLVFFAYEKEEAVEYNRELKALLNKFLQ